MLLDRERECAEIESVLAAARSGLSGSLVLNGEAGIGKTALLEYAIDAAEGFRVERIVGIESEMELGFAALHQFLLPFGDWLDTLPTPQRAAVDCAFGLVEESPPSRFLVSLACLTVLSNAAQDAPLLCVVDDAQWLDQESADALAFVARRVHADQVAMLFAVRETGPRRVNFGGIAELQVQGLRAEASRQLLTTAVGTRLDERVAERIVSETRGNPLALVELGDELLPDPSLAASTRFEPLPIGRRLEAQFRRRVASLSADTQTLLLLGATEPTGATDLVLRAAEQFGITGDAVSEAEANDLLNLGPPLSFRHPLIRSAVYSGATNTERRRAHGALASACDPVADVDLRAWHRAAAALDPDEEIARELEDASERAQRRGGYAAGAAFLIRAARVTPDVTQRVRRLLAAATLECEAAPSRAQVLLDEAASHLDDDFQRAFALRLRGEIRYALGEARETAAILRDAAYALAPFDVHLARETLLDAVTAVRVSGRFGESGAMSDLARAALEVRLPDGEVASTGDVLLEGFARLRLEGVVAAAPLLRRAVRELGAENAEVEDSMRWLVFGGWAAAALCDIDETRALARRSLQLARDQGAFIILSRALHNLAIAELLRGSLDAAAVQFAEGRVLFPPPAGAQDLGEVIMLAWRGQEDEARTALQASLHDANARQQGWIIEYVEYAFAILELGLGNYADALTHASDAAGDDSYLLGVALLPDIVEAGVRGNARSSAVRACEELTVRAELSGTPLALGLLARSRALLAPDHEAEAAYLDAIEHFRTSRATAHLARSHLVYGEWLRRKNRRNAAREQLELAEGLFEAMGAQAFTQRARRELVATGGRPRTRTVETRDELTPQEAQVARFAASGATNSEIGAQLFISPSTVDYHLRKVYRKLDISSRRHLARALSPEA